MALIQAPMRQLIAYRLAIVWAVLYILSALGTCILVAFQGGVKWIELDGQAKFLLCVSIAVNVCTVLGAFISKEAKSVASGNGPTILSETPQNQQPPETPANNATK